MTYVIDETTGCHVWRGRCSEKGYALVSVRGVAVRVTRLLWKLLKGPIPAGRLLCHKCDNPPCINLDHLYVGTPKQNTQDAVARDRLHRPSGTANPSAQLTEDQVLDIYLTKDAPSSAADRHGCSASTVCKIRGGWAWNEVTGLPQRR
jgi:hypothetical protein